MSSVIFCSWLCLLVCFLYSNGAAMALSLPRETPLGCRANGTSVNTTACSGNGLCVLKTNSTDYYCQCKDQYDGTFCEVEKKSGLVALLLSFWLGAYAADRFYLGYALIGGIKLALAVVVCCGSLLGKLVVLCCQSADDYETINNEDGSNSSKSHGIGTALGGFCSLLLTCSACLGSLAVFGWWAADLIMISTGELNDHDGYPLYKDY